MTGTVGVFTPRQGWSNVTWSFSAVVKIALRTILLCRIVAGVTPAADSAATHSRTQLGKTSSIRIDPKVGMRCLSMEYR